MDLHGLPLVRRYQTLARRGFVPPLTHSCGNEYTVRVEDETVKFQCFACGTMTDPGLADTKAMEARIEDYKAKRK